MKVRLANDSDFASIYYQISDQENQSKANEISEKFFILTNYDDSEEKKIISFINAYVILVWSFASNYMASTTDKDNVDSTREMFKS